MGKATSTSATQLVEKNYKRPIHTFPSSTMRKLRMAGIAEHKTNEYLNEKFMSFPPRIDTFNLGSHGGETGA